ncbi:MAG: CapA family protein, partial [Lachnospiraceae bacterium]|nr:CapA family protein [Lachnospiraceae bacterium]
LLYRIFPAALLLLVTLPVLASALLPRRQPPVTEEPYYVHSETRQSIMGKPLYRTMSRKQQESFEGAYRILFAGDLILLEDQVRRAYNGKEYDFSDCFAYTASYIQEADFAIGVLEGPLAGEEAGYSNGNYTDIKQFWLNFPDEWGAAVRDAGFDLVTTANNHALDRGIPGLKRSLAVLEELGLDRIGTYASEEERAAGRVRIIENQGLKMAVLAYTYGMNGYRTSEIFQSPEAYVTTWLPSKDSEVYEAARKEIEADFLRARQENPDLILVLPHWGTQFETVPDAEQQHWEAVFKELGADIILGDHTHSVQPVYMEQREGRKVYTLYCPGNYANIFRGYDGDFCAMTEIYIDRDSKELLGGSIIPMWVTASGTGNYRPLPLYLMETDPGLKQRVSVDDAERAGVAKRQIARIMLGEFMDSAYREERWFFDEKGYMRSPCPQLEPDESLQRSEVFRMLSEAERICFVGDSITEGSANGGVGWFEPLETFFKSEPIRCGWGSSTVQTLLRDHRKEIGDAKADLFVIAIGTNDIRYREEDLCAMTPEAYTESLKELRELIQTRNPSARFLFVAPWTAQDGDSSSRLAYGEKKEMIKAYTEALRTMCRQSGDGFSDPNPYIESWITKYPQSEFLLDAIHPNNDSGVRLYAEAVLQGGQ